MEGGDALTNQKKQCVVIDDLSKRMTGGKRV